MPQERLSQRHTDANPAPTSNLPEVFRAPPRTSKGTVLCFKGEGDLAALSDEENNNVATPVTYARVGNSGLSFKQISLINKFKSHLETMSK